jgi:hypothetical protein
MCAAVLLPAMSPAARAANTSRAITRATPYALGLYLLGALPAPPVARADATSHVQLSYTAPSQCPQAAEVLAAIDRQLGAGFQTDTQLQAQAEVIAHGSRDYELVIDYTASSGATDHRRVHAESCKSAAEGAALLLALALIPAEAAPPPAAAPTALPHNEFAFLAQVDSAIMPRLAIGMGLQVGLRLGAFRLQLMAAQWLRQQTNFGDIQSTFEFWSVGVGACYLADFDLVQAGPCTRIEIGRLAGYAEAVEAARPDGARLQAVSLGAQARLRLFSPLWLMFDAALEWLERRPEFIVTGFGRLHQPATWGARLAFGPLLIW